MKRYLLAAIFCGFHPGSEAHHAAAPHFFLDRTITLEGVVTDFRFVNPHSYIYFDVTDTQGNTSNWRCSLTTVARLRSRGWSDDSLQPGQRITLTGSPARREDNHCLYRSMILADGRVATSEFPRGAAELDTLAADTIAAEARPRYLPNGQPDIRGPWVTPPTDFVPGQGVGMGARGGMGGGAMPAATPAGELAAEGYEPIYDHPAIACHPVNIISAWAADGAGNTVSQEDDRITLQYGFMDLVRTIHLDQPTFPENIAPSVGGYSIGRWEGDVLVVNTRGFEPGVLSARTGLMYSDQMEVNERFEASQDGERIVRSFTVHDPLFLESDWIGEDELIRTSEPQELFNCVNLEGANNERPVE